MATPYAGKAGNVVFPAAGTVTNVVVGSGILTITVSGSLPTSMQTGATVDISGVVGIAAVNCQAVATVTGSATFTIPVTGTGTYSSGGSVSYQFDLTAPSTPNDGDTDSAASVNGALAEVLDRTAEIFVATGACKVTQIGSSAVTNSSSAIASTTTWAYLNSAQLTITNLNAGDVVEVEAQCSWQITSSSASSNLGIAIGAAQYANGGSPSYATSAPANEVAISGAGVTSPPGCFIPATLTASVTASQPNVQFALGAGGASSATLAFGSAVFWRYRVWRATGVPQ